MATHAAPQTVSDDGLSAVLSDRFALQAKHLFVCLAFAVYFMYLNYIPLFHTDIWCHVHYGKWILQHGALPAEDPFMPLAAGMRVVDTAWLAQILFAQVETWGGAQFLSNLFAIVVLGSYLVQARVFFLITGNIRGMLLCLLLVMIVGWTRHAIIRPEVFGSLFLAVLMWLLVRLEPWRSRAAAFREQVTTNATRWPWYVWTSVPLLFLLWANMHGSYAVGLVLLGCHAGGRAVEVAWQSRSLRGLLADRDLQRWILLTESALLATLCNPYGVDLLITTATFGGTENLRDILEWFPLKLIDLEGIQFSISILVFMVLMRHSRERVRPADVLLLLAFTTAVAPAIRMIGWFSPVLALVSAPHVANVIDRWRRRRARPTAPEPGENAEPSRRLAAPQFVYTMLALLAVWCAFALSPISEKILGGKPRDPDQIYGRHTPRGITEYLRQHPPEQLVFTPQWWGDWTSWDGPPQVRVFMTTMVHLAPRRVWRDYMSVARGESGWQQILDRYDVGVLLADKELQAALTAAVRRSSAWKIEYEDENGIVAVRSS